MGMNSSQRYVGHVLFEGSSTAKGHGDPEGLGYAGRIEQYYRAYNKAAQHKPGQTCRYVYTHMHGQPDRNMTQYVHDLEQHALEARRLTFSGLGVRLVGVFVVSAYLTAITAQQGEGGALRVWRDTLERLEDICSQQDIAPVLVAPPDPLPGATFANGKPVPVHMWRRTAAMSHDRVNSLGADYVAADQILGARKGAYMAEDDLHLNAAGYGIVAENIIIRIDDALGIQ